MDSKDIIETFEGSIIQHGSYNDRIYLIKLAPDASSITPSNLIDLARTNNYSKIFVKVPECHSDIFSLQALRQKPIYLRSTLAK